MRSRTEISESTVSCTPESRISTPTRRPSASSGAVKQPTQTRLMSRPVKLSRMDGVCGLQMKAVIPIRFAAQNSAHLRKGKQRAAAFAECVIRHLSIRIDDQKATAALAGRL